MAKKLRRQEVARINRQREERRRLYIAIGGVALALLVFLGLVVLELSSQNAAGATASQQVAAAGTCRPIQTIPDEGNAHITPGQTPTYQSQPPSSGPHNPTPLSAGIYDQPVDVTMEVHSLEHGYIVIHYKDIPGSSVDQLKQLVSRDPRKLILAPYPTMNYPVTLTAWDHLQTCTGVDQASILAFISSFRDRGPENVP